MCVGGRGGGGRAQKYCVWDVRRYDVGPGEGGEEGDAWVRYRCLDGRGGMEVNFPA